MCLCIDGNAIAKLGGTIAGLAPADFVIAIVSYWLPRTGLTMLPFGEAEAQPGAGAQMSLPGIG